jgi:hypothetical protein
MAGGDLEIFVDEFDDAIGEIVREIGAEIERAIFREPAGDVDAGIGFEGGVADVGVRFVVAEEDIEFGAVLLDEAVFEGEGLFFVVDDDRFQIGDLADERTGFGVERARVGEIGADAIAEDAGLADVENHAGGVLEEIDAGLQGKGRDFFVEIHRLGLQ